MTQQQEGQDQPGQTPPPPEEINEAQEVVREACLRTLNDPRLSASEKKRQVSVLTGSGFGEMSSAELYGRHSREKG